MADQAVSHEPRRAIGLLVAMLGDDVKPFERLAARCAADGGHEWALPELARMPAGCATIEQWTDLKHSSKRECLPALGTAGEGGPLDGLLRYYASLAGALRDHGAFISSMPRAEVERMLALVGPLLPSPWNEAFAVALRRAREASA